ncbi:Mitochondrial beta-keto-acyl synthase [Cryomyces antarcticus]|uniref:beta-ketoacyl-[acyl-carrier-protein] synthase I n=1 Tax=Cryomyces antarcticus TaxID=329879 RepID=A0ABR0M6X4_9PEZI|nr:Mitochondrial beta-keto-acyl synthase [Cryomyces antarcticus]KAK5014908.1 Mitochondrial beta-keto-acyl synthase [Cryomyces antarcticus]KAK5287811.1 Mitochondrial beta-keto-acyl synthase [Cryomyces antarcticus]
MATFAQYAMVASEEALHDAGWRPETAEDLEATGVYVGSGIGNFEDVYETSIAYDKGGYKKVSPLFVPRLLINLAAGHISMRFGFKVGLPSRAICNRSRLERGQITRQPQPAPPAPMPSGMHLDSLLSAMQM